jgi:phage regulator Rha-like protein
MRSQFVPHQKKVMNLVIIQNKIYEIRGQKVMLDFDLAELYQLETKRLKEAVRRNSTRFPPDFMFELTKEEYVSLRTQFATLKKTGRGKHLKYMPFAFTEHGVTMLASVLNSDRAIEMNIAIVRAFIALRQIALHNKDLAEKLDQLKNEMYDRLGEHDAQLNAIYDAIENMLDEKTEKKSWEERERIGFKNNN